MSDRPARWPDGVRLYVNGGPDDHCELWDIWRDGGPGAPVIGKPNVHAVVRCSKRCRCRDSRV